MHSKSIKVTGGLGLVCLWLAAAGAATGPSAVLDAELPGFPDPETAFLSSNAGLHINPLVGADRFYHAGFNGAGVIAANIEAGHLWDGHESLGHASLQVTGDGALGDYDAHATWAAFTMGGRIPLDPEWEGMAPGATLWSGAIATEWAGNAYATGFGITLESMGSVYKPVMVSGVNGQTARVVNNSWGYGVPSGFSVLTLGIDGYVAQGNVVNVAAAGNQGPAGNTVGGMAAGYNSISVGALGSDTDQPPYNAPASFSSRGPNTFVEADSRISGFDRGEIRPAVDLVAPGQNLTLALYDGQQGGNAEHLTNSPAFGGPTGAANLYLNNLQGTSFAAPIVAGGAALLVGAGMEIYENNPQAVDARVIKAVLMNSARKIEGWNNHTYYDATNDIRRTDQALDFTSGAGALDLDQAYDQYMSLDFSGRAGTTGLPASETGDLGPVHTVGWDLGLIDYSAANTYFFDEEIPEGRRLSATLNWFVDRNPGEGYFEIDDLFGEERFANLDLYLFAYDNPEDRNPIGDVAASLSLVSNTEHLYMRVAETGYYGLRVEYADDLWNFTGADSVEYGLAWFIPEPGSFIILLLGGAAAFWMRRTATRSARAHRTKAFKPQDDHLRV